MTRRYWEKDCSNLFENGHMQNIIHWVRFYRKRIRCSSLSTCKEEILYFQWKTDEYDILVLKKQYTEYNDGEKSVYEWGKLTTSIVVEQIRDFTIIESHPAPYSFNLLLIYFVE